VLISFHSYRVRVAFKTNIGTYLYCYYTFIQFLFKVEIEIGALRDKPTSNYNNTRILYFTYFTHAIHCMQIIVSKTNTREILTPFVIDISRKKINIINEDYNSTRVCYVILCAILFILRLMVYT